MRKVLIKEWIPAELIKEENWSYPKQGTACWSEFKTEGLFHAWGVNSEEVEGGALNYSIGIIELSNGEIKEVLPSNIKLLNNTRYEF